jgi:hypothetical protein
MEIDSIFFYKDFCICFMFLYIFRNEGRVRKGTVGSLQGRGRRGTVGSLPEYRPTAIRLAILRNNLRDLYPTAQGLR